MDVKGGDEVIDWQWSHLMSLLIACFINTGTDCELQFRHHNAAATATKNVEFAERTRQRQWKFVVTDLFSTRLDRFPGQCDVLLSTGSRALVPSSSDTVFLTLWVTDWWRESMTVRNTVWLYTYVDRMSICGPSTFLWSFTLRCSLHQSIGINCVSHTIGLIEWDAMVGCPDCGSLWFCNIASR